MEKSLGQKQKEKYRSHAGQSEQASQEKDPEKDPEREVTGEDTPRLPQPQLQLTRPQTQLTRPQP